jgi:hypothetical protein
MDELYNLERWLIHNKQDYLDKLDIIDDYLKNSDWEYFLNLDSEYNKGIQLLPKTITGTIDLAETKLIGINELCNNRKDSLTFIKDSLKNNSTNLKKYDLRILINYTIKQIYHLNELYAQTERELNKTKMKLNQKFWV